MAGLPASPTAPGRAGRPFRWPKRLATVAWAGWVAAVGSLSAQFHLGVYDTVGWLWLPFWGLAGAAGLAAAGVGLVRLVVGPRRQTALGWAAVGFAPVLLSAVLVAYMFIEQGHKNLPNTEAHKVGRTAAVTLLKTHAALRYPRRTESGRLVMYSDDSVTDPAGDLADMDAHLARLEGVLGRRQKARIHWVRGGAVGMRAMSIHSIALASDASPAGWFDRHELAHSFLYQFSQPGAEPPMLLLEGWAMAVDGHPGSLAEAARTARQQFTARRGTTTCLRSILAPDLYHVGTAYAYDLGGALVDFLLRRYGPDRFLRFYNEVRPNSFDADCERAFGCGLDSLEAEFCADLDGR